MNAFQFGYQVKAAMRKSAATAAEMLAPYGSANPGSLYPFSANPAKHPEYAPRTPAQTFRGTKVEADIPPTIFPKDNVKDEAMDSDSLYGVFNRQQSGQGLDLGGIGGDGGARVPDRAHPAPDSAGQGAEPPVPDAALHAAVAGEHRRPPLPPLLHLRGARRAALRAGAPGRVARRAWQSSCPRRLLLLLLAPKPLGIQGCHQLQESRGSPGGLWSSHGSGSVEQLPSLEPTPLAKR